MVRSARRAAVALMAATALAGCTTTQHEAQRERLDSARQRAALKVTRVVVSNPSVTATSIGEVREGRRTAWIVTVHNAGRRAVTDLPISLGYVAPGGADVYLNSAADLNYFEAHLPAIRAGRALTWVFTTDRKVPIRARTFARVGRRPSAPAQLTEMNVRIGARYRLDPGGRSLHVRLVNPTGVPQYQLQVYAYAKRGGRYVAAATKTIAELGAGSSRTLRLLLVGVDNHEIRLQAVPTVLQ